MNPFPIAGARRSIRPCCARTPCRGSGSTPGWTTAAAGRLGLIVAEAGFGKTTLLADWAGRSPRATAWYRLEPDDRDWLTFIRHLVAAGRELDPDFAPDTLRLFLCARPGRTDAEDIASQPRPRVWRVRRAAPAGLTLILDDYHAVDGCAETEPIRARPHRPDGPRLLASSSPPGRRPRCRWAGSGHAAA